MPKIESVKKEGIQRISATICMGQDSQCLPYAAFYLSQYFTISASQGRIGKYGKEYGLLFVNKWYFDLSNRIKKTPIKIYPQPICCPFFANLALPYYSSV